MTISKKISNKESTKQKEKNNIICNSKLDSNSKSQFKFKGRVTAANILAAASYDKIRRRE